MKRHPQSAPLIRRILSGDGTIVTYLEARDVIAHTGVSSATLSRWSRTGVVRTIGALRGSQGYALVDVVSLRLVAVKDSIAAGLRRTPPNDLEYGRGWRRNERDATRPLARKHGEEWSTRDMESLAEMYAGGTPLEEIAIELGRTYEACTCRLDWLRSGGADELRRLRPIDRSAVLAAVRLLTTVERESLQLAGD